MGRKFILSMIITAPVILFPSVFAQISSTGEHRIIQPITVKGQPAQGVLVMQDARVQTYRCRSPELYVTADHSENGWACFEQATGMWLLHAEPPSQADDAARQQSPEVIYSEPDTTYVPAYGYGYGYPYPYYPYYPFSHYGHPYFWGPAFGFGFNFRHNGHGFHDGHGFAHGGFNHGATGFAHRGPAFGHAGGGFAHGGGGFQGGRGFGGHMGGGRR